MKPSPQVAKLHQIMIHQIIHSLCNVQCFSNAKLQLHSVHDMHRMLAIRLILRAYNKRLAPSHF